MSKIDKKILAELYLASLRKSGKNFLDSMLDTLNIERKGLIAKLDSLSSRGLVKLNESRFALTSKGRDRITVVMAGGAFDIIHPGHIETLEKSKALGDVLVVSVARDVTFERNKKREPLHDEEKRRSLVLALKPVDAAVLGSETDIIETVEFLRPDIIALGYDQFHSERKIAKEAGRRGIKVKVVRLESSIPSIKTSKILANEKSILRQD